MINISHQLLAQHSAERMFMLVADVESYPSFAPACGSASISAPSVRILDCGLAESFQGCLVFKKSLRTYQLCTRNRHYPYERIDMSLVSGPMRSLAGSWIFAQQGPNQCLLSCDLRIVLANKFIERALQSNLDSLFASLTSALVQEADRRYAG